MDSVGAFILVLRFLLFIYDFITYPIYYLIYHQTTGSTHNNPSTKNGKRTYIVRSSETDIVVQSLDRKPLNVVSDGDTMSQAWKASVLDHGPKPLLGTRDTLSEEREVQPDGKTFVKVTRGSYRWATYEEADETIGYIGRGLRLLDMAPRDKIAIYADTRSEWFLTAQACFKHNFTIVTLYTNLGEEAIIHGINQTRVSHVVTSHELIPKLRSILSSTPKVSKVIYFENPLRSDYSVDNGPDVQFVPYSALIALGKAERVSDDDSTMGPVPQDPAIIMFTSGSTGIPKGVVLSHRNLIATLRSLACSLGFKMTKSDCYFAYLPLAHVLELLSEMIACLVGVRVGYSHPNTLTDKSSMIKQGHKGDASLLKPTVMSTVPLVLDRIYKSAISSINKRGEFFSSFFSMCYDYRLTAIKKGQDTPILNYILFRKIKAFIGGRLETIICGGAPLASQVHDFIRVTLGVQVIQGYGLTETTVTASLMEMIDYTTNSVGIPNQFAHVKLVNWDEGSYRVTDSPHPRGEIHVGGDFVSEGYFEMPETTNEQFYEEYGRRWFRTGDIGEYLENGNFRIIDRKKDLVKLQFGEYVSLGKVESVLKSCPSVENLCVYGDSSKMYCVALVVPSRPTLEVLAEVHGKQEMSFEDLCNDEIINDSVLRELVNHGKKMKLEKFEIPGVVTLCKELWAPDSGLVTAAFKLKRKPIQDFYQRDLDRMYGSTPSSSTPLSRGL